MSASSSLIPTGASRELPLEPMPKNGNIDRKLNDDLSFKIFSLLNDQDLESFARTSKRNYLLCQREATCYDKKLQQEILAAPVDLQQHQSSSKHLEDHETYKSLFLQLINSPQVDNPRQWASSVKPFLQQFSGFGPFYAHMFLIEILKSMQTTHQEEINLFVNLLGDCQELFADQEPWVVCRIFEKYAEISPKSARKALEKQLNIIAEREIKIRSFTSDYFQGQYNLTIGLIEIDMSNWIGKGFTTQKNYIGHFANLNGGHAYHLNQLWNNPSEKNPELIQEFIGLIQKVIWAQIEKLHNSKQNQPLRVILSGIHPLPISLINLVNQINTKENLIFDPQNPAIFVPFLSEQQYLELAQQYPEAVQMGPKQLTTMDLRAAFYNLIQRILGGHPHPQG